jgi:hypothetical protein
MNNVLRIPTQRAIISYGGTENWQRKENLVAAVKAVQAKAKQYNAPNVDVLYLLTKQRSTPREYHQLILNWLEN